MAIVFITLSIISSSFAQQSKSEEVFEMRVYFAAPGKLNSLIKRFQDHTTALFEKQGIVNVGYWVPINNTENKLIYILKYPNLQAKTDMWKAFLADPEWSAVRTASEANGKLIDKIESTTLTSASFFPYIGETEKNRGVFELRIYDPEVGKLGDLCKRFEDHTVALFNKHGMENVAYWISKDADGKDAKLIYILSHKSEEAGKASFDTFRTDEAWIKARTASEANGRLATSVNSTYMKALPLSKTN